MLLFMSNSEFRFKEKKTTSVFTLKQIMLENKPVLFVSHDKDDGSWQFFSGDKFKMSDAMVVSLDEMTSKDPSLNQLFDLPRGWQASRSTVTEEWLRIQVK